MAQVMKYHQHPAEPNDFDPDEVDGRRRYWIYVNGVMENSPRFLKGGDGSGGPYKWELMPNLPGCGNSTEQRQAVGSICYDAGIAVDTWYYSRATSVHFLDIRDAFLDVFDYSNAIGVINYNSDSYLNIDEDDLIRMVNPNLDAGNPIIFMIANTNVEDLYVVICDGYGYNASTMYHHLNMGWDFLPVEFRNVWYELPNISDYCEWVEGRYRYWFEYNYNTICGCIYNIFTSETGEIISGRVVDADGMPIEGVEITTHGSNGVAYNVVTNEKGVYAFKGLKSNSTYAISAEKYGFNFNTIIKSTGKSEHDSSVCGNQWGADFVGSVDSETVVIGSGSYNWDYPMHTEQQDSRTQVIYLADEISRSGNITNMALNVTKIPGQVLVNWTIRMKHTSMDEYDSDNYSLDNDGWTIVYQNNESIVDQGWYSFEFQTPFEYNGIDNLLIDFSHNNNSATENGECRVSNSGQKRSVYACSNSTGNDPLNWPLSPSPIMHISSYVPNVKLTLGTASHEIIREIKLTALDGEPDDRFGCSVSLSGDYAIVGAYKKDNNCGAAYIFKREGTN
jgi:hypothetical protein